MLKKLTKTEIKKMSSNLFLVLIGNIVLAFGSAIFLTKLNIVSGGLTGIGIIFQYFFKESGQVTDIVVTILTWTLWILSLFLLKWDFARKTLVSAIVFPLSLSLFLRIPFFDDLANQISYYGTTVGQATAANVLLCAVFSGICVGAGVALNFKGGGSTGGLDVIIAILEKYAHIKASIGSFVLDATVVVCGMFIIPNNIVPGLCGLLSALLAALLVEIIYVSGQSCYQIDIISDYWELISGFAQNYLERGATIMPCKGGYKGQERTILRVVIHRSEYNLLRRYIAEIDPKAFVTFTQTNAVFGDGFEKHRKK